MTGSEKERLLFLLVGVAGALVLIGVLHAVLPDGDLAKRILDKPFGPDHRTIPYPLTIQNLMTVLLGVGLGDVFLRRRRVGREAAAVEASLLPEDDGEVVVPRDAGPLRERLRTAGVEQRPFLARLADQCILYFVANEAPDQTHQVLTSMTDLEMHDIDLRYTLLRYLAWAIPTVGFIGTVLGIAEALGAIDTANPGAGMSLVTANLALAFDTTLVALCYSAVLVLLVQFTQKAEEEAVNRSASYCLENLINRLYVPKDRER